MQMVYADTKVYFNHGCILRHIGAPNHSYKINKNRNRYNNINSQLDATIINFINNFNQLNMFRAIILPILRSARLCLQLVV